jgi:tetrapyrrole methylase family protein / MazG family protein
LDAMTNSNRRTKARPPNGRDSGKDWLAEAVRIMARLRAEGGCPWDRQQTHQTLKRSLVEETSELLDAIDDREDAALRDELGDVLLQVIFHAQIAADEGRFDVQDVAQNLCEKLVRRHPHVFGQAGAATADQVTAQWEEIKKLERKAKGKVPGADGALAGVPRHLPALARAHKIQDRAAKAGFDWPDSRGVLDKIEEELSEVRQAMAGGDQDEAREEIGDLLFAVAKLSRYLGHPPEEALHQTIRKFERRFTRMEQWLAEQGKTVESCGLAELEVLWKRAKQEERHAKP